MSQNSVIVYTAISSEYDVLMNPIYVPQNVDFVCFTDDPRTITGVWEARPLPGGRSPKQQISQVKILPHKHFPDYDWSIWIDGNIWVTGDITDIINGERSGIVTRQHPRRTCIYDEAVICVSRDLADRETVENQMARYRKNGLPKNYGLSDLALIIRRHNEMEVKKVMETWWEEFQCGAIRQQLSFEYALWKHAYTADRLHIDFDNSANFQQFWHKQSGIIGRIQEIHYRSLERIIDTTGIIPTIFIYSLLSISYLLFYSWLSVYILREYGAHTLAHKILQKTIFRWQKSLRY